MGNYMLRFSESKGTKKQYSSIITCRGTFPTSTWTENQCIVNTNAILSQAKSKVVSQPRNLSQQIFNFGLCLGICAQDLNRPNRNICSQETDSVASDNCVSFKNGWNMKLCMCVHTFSCVGFVL